MILLLALAQVSCFRASSIKVEASKNEPSTEVDPDGLDSAEDSVDSGEPGGCYAGPVTTQIHESRDSFEAALSGLNLALVDFDDVDTAGESPVSIDAERYLASHGIVITGQDGQFVDDKFLWDEDYIPVSGPNMYAPGPAIIDAGGFNTEVRFRDEGCVHGFGLMFIDADFPENGPSGLTVFDAAGEELSTTPEFSSSSGGAVFRGMLTVDDQGVPIPAIAKANLVNGSVWPMSNCCDGVTLDDFVFSEPY